MIAGGISDTVIVTMRFAIVMMTVRMLVGDFGRSNIPGFICVNVGTAQLQHQQANADDDCKWFSHAAHLSSIHNGRPTHV